MLKIDFFGCVCGTLVVERLNDVIRDSFAFFFNNTASFLLYV